jgi:hypothetical protein
MKPTTREWVKKAENDFKVASHSLGQWGGFCQGRKGGVKSYGLSFQEEFLALLRTHPIPYDDRHLWG